MMGADTKHSDRVCESHTNEKIPGGTRFLGAQSLCHETMILYTGHRSGLPNRVELQFSSVKFVLASVKWRQQGLEQRSYGAEE
jgi:hypothetical protein